MRVAKFGVITRNFLKDPLDVGRLRGLRALDIGLGWLPPGCDASAGIDRYERRWCKEREEPAALARPRPP